MTAAKRRQLVLSAALAGMCAQPVLAAGGGNVKHMPVWPSDRCECLSVDVPAFGTKGDGATDDTEAIRPFHPCWFRR